LFPVAHPDSSTKPFVEHWDGPIILRYPEVVYPAPDVFFELFHSNIQEHRNIQGQVYFLDIGFLN